MIFLYEKFYDALAATKTQRGLGYRGVEKESGINKSYLCQLLTKHRNRRRLHVGIVLKCCYWMDKNINEFISNEDE